jgi:enoyl-[acyl-carrier protein] reductase I
MTTLSGTALITGVANDKSIAWAIAQAAHAAGADIVMPYQDERLAKRVRPLADSIGARTIQCDFTDKAEVDGLFEKLADGRLGGPLRYAVHAIAFSDKEELNGRFLDTSLENFLKTMRVSCFSFMDMARRCQDLMKKNSCDGDRGSILALTYYASHRPHPHYNVMGVAKAALESAVQQAAYELGEFGIRANALSPSPVDTLSARGIGGFRSIGAWAEGMSMLGRRATLKEIANAAAFYLSRQSSAITGQVAMIDGGASVSGMPPVRHARKIGEDLLGIAGKAEGGPSRARQSGSDGPSLRDISGEYLTNDGEPEETGSPHLVPVK